MKKSINVDMRCFIDSNVWFYIFAETSEKTQAAESLLHDPQNEIIISTQIINEVCSNLIRKVKFSESRIREIIRDYYEHFEICGIDQETLLKASELRQRYKFSYWDSIIAASALLSDSSILYSEDMQDGFSLEKQLKIKNPF